ncbi:MAG TPA: hypothetical protein VMI10_24505 [Terriglobales bacterium]|nr:hypothetical protein [Terriglobales bacterium]
MLKFTLASRHADGGTRERFFYEWSIMHVALMLTTPSVMKLFKRYVQHFNIPEVTDEVLFYPLSSEKWESFAEHIVDSHEAVVASVHNRDYVERMQAHKFGSHRFITSLSNFRTVYEREGFASGGVKLIHFLKRAAGVTQQAFNEMLCSFRAPGLARDVCGTGLVRKYVVNTLVDLDPAVFKGTLFEFGSIGMYAGIEEFWIDGDLGKLAELRRCQKALDAIRSTEAELIDASGSISMVVKERVVWDFVTPNGKFPAPAISNPDSLEATIDRQGYKPWLLA